MCRMLRILCRPLYLQSWFMLNSWEVITNRGLWFQESFWTLSWSLYNKLGVQTMMSIHFRSPDIVCATFIHIEQYRIQWRRDCKGLAHKFCLCVCVQSFSNVWHLDTLWTVVHQALLSIGFSRQNYWNELSFSIAREFPIPGLNPHLLHLWLW